MVKFRAKRPTLIGRSTIVGHLCPFPILKSVNQILNLGYLTWDPSQMITCHPKKIPKFRLKGGVVHFCLSSFSFSRCNEASSRYLSTKQICFVFVSYHCIVIVFVTHQSRWAENHSSCVRRNEYFGSREDWRQSRRKKWPGRHQR